jgi:hypothetical protein
MMNHQMVGEGDWANSLREVVSVKAPQEVAWRTFTEKMGTWWPLATYKIGNAKAVDAVIEPRVGGGRWYEPTRISRMKIFTGVETHLAGHAAAER